MSDETNGMKRRTFLCVLSAAGVASVAPGCGGSTNSTTPFSAGAVTDHPANLWKLYAGERVIVGHDAGGYFAYTAICTDQGTTIGFRDGTACATPTGCTSESSNGYTVCPLHMSRYDPVGAVLNGPAASPLNHFQVTIAGGQLTVNPGVTVAASARTAAA